LHQAGLRNTVGLMGTALTENQVGELAKLGKRILLALDADSAGQEAMLRAAKLAQGRRLELRVVPLPPGADPADLVQQEGAQAAQRLVESSVPFVRFRVERELADGDLGTAEGKDKVIDELRPVFATLPPSAIREELVALVADRTDLAPSLVSSWLPVPGKRAAQGAGTSSGRASGRGGHASDPGSGSNGDTRGDVSRAAPAAALDPTVRAERALLAYCLANRDAGQQALDSLPGDAFTDDLNRRAAEHLRAHLAKPEEGLPEEEDRLRRLVAALVAQASQGQRSRAALDAQLARVEHAHIKRQMAAAIAAGAGGVTELKGRLARVEERLDEHLARQMDEDRPA
jgi:DNA primase